jgi:hypothetical protein
MLGTFTRAARRAGEEREVDRLALEDLRLRRLELDHDPVPLGLREGERVAREVQVDRPVEIAVRKGMVLVRAEVARAADGARTHLRWGRSANSRRIGRGAVGPAVWAAHQPSSMMTVIGAEVVPEVFSYSKRFSASPRSISR